MHNALAMQRQGDGRTAGGGAMRVGGAAVLLASSILLSRILGYLREAVLAYRVGAGAATDAYYAAFQIPDLLNYLLAGGALSIAFVPLYTQRLARGDAEEADRLFATVLGSLGTVAVVATAALWWFAEPLVAVQFPRFAPQTQALTVHLTRIVLPAQVFFITGGIINATLLARDRFGAAALAPLLYNGAIIAGGLFLAPHMSAGVEAFSWGALVGAVAGPFLAPLLDARGRVRLRVRVALTDRAFLAYLVIATPLMFGQTLLTVDEWYGRWFGALLGAGTVAHLGYARRLMLVPVAVVGQAIAAAALPTLSRLWAETRLDELNRVVLRTLQAGVAFAVFAAGGAYVLSHEVVQVCYQHGAFSAEDTASVAAILAVLSLAVPAWITQQIAARAFYARGDTWRPMVLGTVVALAAIPLYLVLGHRLGVLGLAAAGVIGMSVNAVATLGLARWLHGAPDLTRLLGSSVRAVAIAVVASAATHRLGVGTAQNFPDAALHLAAGGMVFGLLVLAGVFTVGDEPMRQALRRALRRRQATENKP
jgi:putative peptidoglycan lipid II flippase